MAFCKCVRSICILAFNGGKGQRQKDIERKRESNERKLERARGRERDRERGRCTSVLRNSILVIRPVGSQGPPDTRIWRMPLMNFPDSAIVILVVIMVTFCRFREKRDLPATKRGCRWPEYCHHRDDIDIHR